MALFDQFFGKRTAEAPPAISFGRYTDAYKVPACYEAWEQAQQLFDRGEFLRSYEQFFHYLRDDQQANVRCEEAPHGLRFEIYQGSKKITGLATPRKLRAEAPIVKADTFNVSLLRRLLEHNYDLQYCRFALDGKGNIIVVFDTYTLDGSPYKLYHALRELALKADKHDDLLLEEFRQLEPLENSHLEALPQTQKEVKYQYVKQEIEAVLREMEQGPLDKGRYASSYGYLLLDLIFRLDYLVKPEGYMMEQLERLHRQYYANDGLSTAAKNDRLAQGLSALAERPAAGYYREMYLVKSTFGMTPAVGHERIASIIDGELYHIDWYIEHGHDRMAMAITGYVIGFCLFNYAVPKLDRELFHLYYEITEGDYFRDLGFRTVYYDGGSGKFDKRAVRKALQQIVARFRDEQPGLSFPYGELDYGGLPLFARSYLRAIRSLG